MTPIAFIEAVATVFWVYAGVGFAQWALHLVRAERRDVIPIVTDLVMHLVPVSIGLVAVVMVGAVIGFPSVVVFIAVLFPGGLTVALTQALKELSDASWRAELIRLAVVLAIAIAVILWRQGPSLGT